MRGIITSFLNSGYTRPGLDIAIASNIPLGGGLSSSSALSIATAAAIQSFISSHPTQTLTLFLNSIRPSHNRTNGSES